MAKNGKNKKSCEKYRMSGHREQNKQRRALKQSNRMERIKLAREERDAIAIKKGFANYEEQKAAVKLAYKDAYCRDVLSSMSKSNFNSYDDFRKSTGRILICIAATGEIRNSNIHYNANA